MQGHVVMFTFVGTSDDVKSEGIDKKKWALQLFYR